MNALQLFKNRLFNIPIREIVELAAHENKPVIEDMNAEQLLRGFDANEKEISPKYRNPLYAQAKQRINSKPKPGTPDLKNTGAFHESISANVSSEGISLDATDEKTEMLKGKYGDDIIGLSEQSIEELKTGYIGPSVQGWVLNHLQTWYNE